MLRSYVTLAFRSLFKHKAISFINITGLALGMAACLLMAGYVRFEWSYDDFHVNRDKLYRVESRFFKNGIITDDWSTSSAGYGTAMQREFPEVERFARLYLWGSERVVSVDDIRHREQNVLVADASFLSLFSFPLVKGHAATALDKPNTVVLSETMARKYFQDRDPLGKVLRLGNNSAVYDCMVTGVFKDTPPNSHLQFNMLISWATLSSRWEGIDEFWYQHEAYTYVQLRPGASVPSIEQRFAVMAERYKTLDALKDVTWGIQLVPLADIHLNPAKANEREVKGSKMVLWVLTGIAALVLFIAWINYINLSATRALERAKEIGIRKTSGARKGMLVGQLMLEAAVVHGLGLAQAVGLVLLITPYMAELAGAGFRLGGGSPAFYLMLVGVFVFGVLFSGGYPAMLAASFDPITALKGKFARRGMGMRKGLVVFQFVASMVLITVSVVIYEQVQFMRQQNKGVDTAQIVVLKTPPVTDDYSNRIEGLRNGLLGLKEIKNVTFSTAVPGQQAGMFLANRRADEGKQENKLYEMVRADHDFIDTYHLQLLYGRNFLRDFKSDDHAVIINEESVRQLGYKDYEDAVGKAVFLETSEEKFRVIGVVKNFHQTSLKDKFTPIMFFISPDFSWMPQPYISMEVASGNWGETLAAMEHSWSAIFPESSFDYFFLDDFIDRQYKADVNFGKLVGIFCTVMIGIACLGLLGLAAYDTLLRKKEVGIRKVLGASIPGILVLLSRDMVKLLLIAYGITLPVAYMASAQWLEGYSFRMALSVWMFVLPLAVLLPIALITVTSQTLKVTLTNPVDSLRSE